jgi:hypothetical protein
MASGFISKDFMLSKVATLLAFRSIGCCHLILYSIVKGQFCETVKHTFMVKTWAAPSHTGHEKSSKPLTGTVNTRGLHQSFTNQLNQNARPAMSKANTRTGHEDQAPDHEATQPMMGH